jgi:hypothetical protein
MLSLVRLTIDSINDQEISKGLVLTKEEIGSVTKLKKFLESHNRKPDRLITFLRHLQNIRSGFLVHRQSDGDTRVTKSMEYFGIRVGNYVGVATEIFTVS